MNAGKPPGVVKMAKTAKVAKNSWPCWPPWRLKERSRRSGRATDPSAGVGRWDDAGRWTPLLQDSRNSRRRSRMRAAWDDGTMGTMGLKLFKSQAKAGK